MAWETKSGKLICGSWVRAPPKSQVRSRGEIGRRNRLASFFDFYNRRAKKLLSAYEETRRVESLKVGEPCEMGIPSQAEKSEGVET